MTKPAETTPSANAVAMSSAPCVGRVGSRWLRVPPAFEDSALVPIPYCRPHPVVEPAGRLPGGQDRLRPVTRPVGVVER